MSYVVTIENHKTGCGEQTPWNNVAMAKKYIKNELVDKFGYTKNQANDRLRFYSADRIKRNRGMKISNSSYTIKIDLV